MTRIATVGVLLMTCGLSVETAPRPEVARAKVLAQQAGDALVLGHYAQFVDLTYPKIVAGMGGRARMIAFLKTSRRQMNGQGADFLAFQAGEPGAPLSAAGNTFVVVPTTIRMKAPGGQLIARSYLLGISADGGRRWRFVDGNGLANPAVREKVLPRQPPQLKLPTPQRPQFIRQGSPGN